MTYALFIDDERDIQRFARVRSDLSWRTARSYDEAVSIMLAAGAPCFISFDHDLGPDRSGMDVARWFVERCLDEPGWCDVSSFDFLVHSANPVGRANIEGLLDRFVRFQCDG